MTAPQLALPSGRRSRPRNAVTLTTLLLVAGGASAVATLIAAWLQAKGLATRWPPKGVPKLDNYPGGALAITLVLSAVLVEWGHASVRNGERRQAISALGLTLGLGAAFLNGLWYLGTRLGFGPGEHAYGTLLFAMLVAVGAFAVASLIFVGVTLARVVGGQVSEADPELARAAAWSWHFVVAAWLAVYCTVYIPGLLFK